MAHVVIKNLTKVTQGKIPPGGTVKVKVDRHGGIVDAYWRRRMDDAKLDNAFAIIPAIAPDKQKPIKKRAD